ncbi:unnamed protein product [Parnassius apollo]|uniref:(apollo) hypothetical protein n=1 Tax=Parnassius apollo TaxID=110799 RepID=A0A8S3WCY7_PARAO|nr:unnamed protein product [Parnassius apollo]
MVLRADWEATASPEQQEVAGNAARIKREQRKLQETAVRQGGRGRDINNVSLNSNHLKYIPSSLGIVIVGNLKPRTFDLLL